MRNKSLIALDRKYLEWLSYQPSALDGAWTQWDGEGRNISCHVRRLSNGSGLGIKPLFSAIPMTDTQHQEQHKHGELFVLVKYRGWDSAFASLQDASDWFESQSIEYLEKWMNETGHNPFFHRAQEFMGAQ